MKTLFAPYSCSTREGDKASYNLIWELGFMCAYSMEEIEKLVCNTVYIVRDGG